MIAVSKPSGAPLIRPHSSGPTRGMSLTSRKTVWARSDKSLRTLREELLNGESFYKIAHASIGHSPLAPELFVPAFATWRAALCRPAPLATLAQRLNIPPGPLSQADQSSVADETSTNRSCAFEDGLNVGLKRSEATAVLEGQAERAGRA